MQQKQQTFLITAGAIILFALAGFFLSFLWQALHTERPVDNFKKYLLNDLNIEKLDESGRGPLYDFYLHRLIESNINSIEVGGFYHDTDLEEYEAYAREAEVLFLNQCEARPQDCHPLWSVMPYCMAQWTRAARMFLIVDLEEQMRETPVFITTLEYWRGYLDEKEWQEDDLNAVLGVAVSEHLCGDLQNLNIEKWSEKTIGVGTTAADLGEKMKHNSRKIQTLIHLHGRVNRYGGINTVIDIPPYEGLEGVCIMPPEKEILTGDVCDLYYYYRNRTFCAEDIAIDYRAEKHFKERYSNPQDLVCQIGLWWRIHGQI